MEGALNRRWNTFVGEKTHLKMITFFWVVLMGADGCIAALCTVYFMRLYLEWIKGPVKSGMLLASDHLGWTSAASDCRPAIHHRSPPHYLLSHAQTHTHMARLHPSFARLLSYWRMRSCAFLQCVCVGGATCLLTMPQGRRSSTGSALLVSQRSEVSRWVSEARTTTAQLTSNPRASQNQSSGWFARLLCVISAEFGTKHLFFFFYLFIVFFIPTVKTLLWIIRCSFSCSIKTVFPHVSAPTLFFHLQSES